MSTSAEPYPYPSESECVQGLQAAKTKRQWEQEHPYENMLEQMRKQMLTTGEKWKLSASVNNTKEMDALFRHANQLHPQHLIGIEWRDQGMCSAHVTLYVAPDLELKRISPQSDLTPSHNRLIIQKPYSDEIMIAVFDETTNTWKIRDPEPSPFLRRIRTKNGTLPMIGRKLSEIFHAILGCQQEHSYKILE